LLGIPASSSGFRSEMMWWVQTAISTLRTVNVAPEIRGGISNLID
jgi:hypothetical protein